MLPSEAFNEIDKNLNKAKREIIEGLNLLVEKDKINLIDLKNKKRGETLYYRGDECTLYFIDHIDEDFNKKDNCLFYKEFFLLIHKGLPAMFISRDCYCVYNNEKEKWVESYYDLEEVEIKKFYGKNITIEIK